MLDIVPQRARIQKRDEPSIDQHFAEMIELLEKVYGKKQEILELATASRKDKSINNERWQK